MFPFMRRRRIYGGFPVRRALLRRVRIARFFNFFVVMALALMAVLLVATPTMASAKSVVRGGGSVHVIRKGDVTPALNCFSTAVFGRTYTYTDTGAIAGSFKYNVYIPTADQALLNVKAEEAGLAAYGTISNGLEIVLAGEKGVVVDDTYAVIAAGGLGEIALGGFTAPADAAGALALVSQVAPNLGDLNWTTVTTQKGNYIFYAYGTKTISTGHGPVVAAVGAKATVYTGPQGNTVVSVQAGTGAWAKLVK